VCGIAGALDLSGRPLDAARLGPMVDALAHRGPDDAGYLLWSTRGDRPGEPGFGQAFADRRFRRLAPRLPVWDGAEGRRRRGEEPWDLLLGHRRLSVLDLSPRSHQPLADAAGRSWLVYNGELYNFRELRAELEKEGVRFRSEGDSEVLLQALRTWGEGALPRLNGMFAFAWWDADRRRLLLARDRYGVKPLYVRVRDGRLAFASEVKALLAFDGRRADLDLLALNEYLSFQNVFSDRTLFDGVRLLPPGHLMRVEVGPGPAPARVRTRAWWDFDFGCEEEAPEDEVAEHLAELLERAVRRQCVSDVSVGSYLSGGMDSGTVAALTAGELGRILTFTLGFDLSEASAHELHFDERARAESLARRLGTEHYECVLHAGDMEACLRDLVWALEDLRCGQCYPNWYVARLAGRFVKVVLSGVGGDELFGGYPWRYAAALARPGEDYVQNYYTWWQRLVCNRDKPRLYAPAVRDRLRELGSEGEGRPFVDHTLSVFQRALRADGRRRLRVDRVEDQVRNALFFECKTFLPGLLVVEDKLSMAHSLETRVPFLDNELVDFASRIPIRQKVGGLEGLQRLDENASARKRALRRSTAAGKVVLRRSMERFLPPDFTRAPKQGFSGPDESWFRGRSAGFVRERLLDPGSGLFEVLDRSYVEEVTHSHLSGRENRRLLLWSLLSLQQWMELFA